MYERLCKKPVNGLLTWKKAYGSRPRKTLSGLEAEGLPVEAVKWNPTTTVIPGVDESKLTYPTIS